MPPSTAASKGNFLGTAKKGTRVISQLFWENSSQAWVQTLGLLCASNNRKQPSSPNPSPNSGLTIDFPRQTIHEQCHFPSEKGKKKKIKNGKQGIGSHNPSLSFPIAGHKFLSAARQELQHNTKSPALGSLRCISMKAGTMRCSPSHQEP